jgi:hypothetical protein
VIARILFVGALLAPAMLHAQRPLLTLDAGVSRMRFADDLEATALSLSPALRASNNRASIVASGTFSKLDASTTSSGLLDASLFTAARRGISGEIQATAGGSAHSDGSTTAQLLGAARLHLDGAARGVWLGAGAGGASTDVWSPMLQGDVGAWFATDVATVSAGLTPSAIEDTIRFTDAWMAVRRLAEPWELTASLGARAGSNLPSLPADDKLWGSIGATYSVSPRLAIVASAGTYPVDLTQGYPGGRYLSIAMRLRSASSVAGSPIAGPTAPIRRFDAVALANGMIRIRVVAPTAQRVEVAGDFTSWQPVSLSLASGIWTVDLRIPAGTHEVAIRADGGAWLAPPGLVESIDEFGGRVGVLRVR